MTFRFVCRNVFKGLGSAFVLHNNSEGPREKSQAWRGFLSTSARWPRIFSPEVGNQA